MTIAVLSLEDSTAYHALKDGPAITDTYAYRESLISKESAFLVEREPCARPDVLIISNHAALRRVLRDTLHADAYNVDAADSIETGLALLRQARHLILLLDLSPSLQGLKLLPAFKADPTLRSAVIIVLPEQNSARDMDIRAALMAGADDYLAAPFDSHDLILQVKLWHRHLAPTVPTNQTQYAGMQIHTLGRFSVEYGSKLRLCEGTKARKAATLFKLLLTHHSRFVPAATIYDLLWPRVSESVAAVDLRSLLHQLRRLLDAPAQSTWPLEHTGATLRLCLRPHDWWDANEFSTWLVTANKLLSAGAKEQAIAAYRAAIALYKGDYLADDSLDEWAAATRSQLSEEWRQALEALASLHGERGETADQERLLRLVLRADPFREHTCRALMSVLASEGRSAEALVLYRQLQGRLQSVLDTGPDPQTHALALRIKQPA